MNSDTDKHERVEAALHTEVIGWCERMVIAAQHYKNAPEVVADFEKLLAMARGEAQ